MNTKMEYSYRDGDDWVFSDPNTYETVNITSEIVGDAKNYLVENGVADITFIQDKAVLLEVPASVILEVSNAPEGIAGDSATNVQKPAKLETGAEIGVPIFINIGDHVKVDTRTGEYIERVKV